MVSPFFTRDFILFPVHAAAGMQIPQGKPLTPAQLQMIRQQQLQQHQQQQQQQQQASSPQIKAVGKQQVQEFCPILVNLS